MKTERDKSRGRSTRNPNPVYTWSTQQSPTGRTSTRQTSKSPARQLNTKSPSQSRARDEKVLQNSFVSPTQERSPPAKSGRNHRKGDGIGVNQRMSLAFASVRDSCNIKVKPRIGFIPNGILIALSLVLLAAILYRCVAVECTVTQSQFCKDLIKSLSNAWTQLKDSIDKIFALECPKCPPCSS